MLVLFLAAMVLLFNAKNDHSVVYQGGDPGVSVSHVPVVIVGDAGLIAFTEKTGGDGSSWPNAIVIENFEIYASGSGSCMEIHNTTLFLVIQDCTFNGSGGYPAAGLILNNCTNVNVTGCKSFNNYMGIQANHLNDSFIVNNNASQNIAGGISLEESHKNIVRKNVASRTSNGHGIYLFQCSWNTVENNTCSANSGGADGIYVSSCSNNTIIRNALSNNAYADLQLSSSMHNNLTGNHLSNTGGWPLYLFYADENLVKNNTVVSTTLGMFIQSSSRNTITNNTCNQTGAQSINILEASNNNVSANVLETTDLSGALFIDQGDDTIIMDNTIRGTGIGLNLRSSRSAQVSGNSLENCSIYIYGDDVSYCNEHEISTSNTIEGSPISYHANATSLTAASIISGAGQVILANCNDSVLAGMTMTGPGAAFSLLFCDNITLEGNSLEGQFHAIEILSSTTCNVSLNDITGCRAYAIGLVMSHYNTITRNNITEMDDDGLLLDSSNYNTITGNNITGDGNYGLSLVSSNHNNISSNVIHECNVNVHLRESTGNTIEQNDVLTSYGTGVFLEYHAHENFIEANNISAPVSRGILADRSDKNVISLNKIFSCDDGLNLYTCNDNIIYKNDIVLSNRWGVLLSSCSNTTTWMNNYTGNPTNVDSMSSVDTNHWDNGTDGNYYSDYLTRYPDATNNGWHWTTPYAMDGGSGEFDYYPLTLDLEPVADFTWNDSSILTNQWVQFNFTGSQGNGETTFLWDFGDGNTSIVANPVHTYNTVGIFDVSLTVEDINGNSSYEMKLDLIEVTLDLVPVATFTANLTSIVPGAWVKFNFTGSEGNGAEEGFSWDFGDGTSSGARNPAHRFTTAGTYTVTLMVTDSDGDFDTNSIIITVSTPGGETPPGVPGAGTLLLIAVSFASVVSIVLKYRTKIKAD